MMSRLICVLLATFISTNLLHAQEQSKTSDTGNHLDVSRLPEFLANKRKIEKLLSIGAASKESSKFAVPLSIDPEELEIYAELSKLPQIGGLVYPTPESICIPDERVRVRNTAANPWNGNCALVITTSTGRRAVGTGWLMGPRLVVTAGHCVHGGLGEDFYATVEVIPGANGASRPFGSQVVRTANLRASTGWTANGAVADDYGAIILPEAFEANGVSPTVFPIAVLSDSELRDRLVSLSGYPGDKAFGTQWTDNDPVAEVLPNRLGYMLDTFGGQSGSAVIPDGTNTAVGIHNYGGCNNHCTRITAAVKTALDQWLAESESN